MNMKTGYLLNYNESGRFFSFLLVYILNINKPRKPDKKLSGGTSIRRRFFVIILQSYRT